MFLGRLRFCVADGELRYRFGGILGIHESLGCPLRALKFVESNSMSTFAPPALISNSKE